MTAMDGRVCRGRTNYLNGLSAEDSVARAYAATGAEVQHHRWRGISGEVDLIVRQGPDLVFIEVKRAKDFARAAQRITRQQMQRIQRAATEYIAGEPDGLLTQIRFDVALVDAHGETDILENVVLH